jgi:importin-7
MSVFRRVFCIPFTISFRIIYRATRQACTVWLKNRVHSCYDIDTSEIRADRTPIPQSDREALRSSLLPLIAASTTRTISIQLAATLKDVISRDFPDKWSTLLPDINRLLSSGKIREVVAGCLAALELVKAFEYVCFVVNFPHLISTLSLGRVVKFFLNYYQSFFRRW